MRFTTRLAKERPAIDMTPLVDVLFLLLIFFLVTSDTLPLKSIRIERPSLVLEAPPIISQLPIVVDEQEVIYVGSKRSIIAAEELLPYLQHEVDQYRSFHQGEPTLVFSVDRRVPTNSSYSSLLRLSRSSSRYDLPTERHLMLHIERDAAHRLQYKSHDPEALVASWSVPLALAALLHLFLYGAIQISSYTTEEKVGGWVELVQLAHQLPQEPISSKLLEPTSPLPWPLFVQEALWELER